MVVKFCDWTDGFTHRGFKNGARVSATLYLIAAWCYILYAAALLAIMLLIGAAAVYIVFKIVFNSNDSQSSVKRNRTLKNSDEMDVTDMIGLRGQKIYSGTNWLTEELNGRVDDEGNIYEGTNWLTEQKIGRIDKDGTIYKGTSWMTEVKVGRIDKDGTIHKGSNWFTEEKIGRIDEDGNIQKGTNWLTEKKSGRIGD